MSTIIENNLRNELSLQNDNENELLKPGENGHLEYKYDLKNDKKNIRERILQLSFQLTRTNEEGVKRLAIVFRSLLRDLFTSCEDELRERKGILTLTLQNDWMDTRYY